MKKKKILILGATGMLGNAVADYFVAMKNKYTVVLTARNTKLAREKWPEAEVRCFDAENLQSINSLEDIHTFDACINCIGVIKPFMSKSLTQSILLNSVLPRAMAAHCKSVGVKFIHITTDCVFSGKDGNYDEDSLHDCLDDYGKSKSLGEPVEDCMVIRTSIIGDEIHKDASLIAWVKSQKGETIKGYSHHYWNGITTTTFADVCHQILQKDLYEEGLFHVFSNKVDKFQLMNIFNEVFELNMTVEEYSDENVVDRSMTTKKDLMSKLNVPSLKKQIKGLVKS